MASSGVFQPPPPIETKFGNVSESGTRWLKLFTIYHEASGNSELPSRQQARIVLQCAGNDIIEASEGESPDNHIDVLRKISQYCTPKKTEVFDRYVFWTNKLCDSPDVDSFILKLHALAASCNFGDQRNNIIRDKIVFSIEDDSLRLALLFDEMSIKEFVQYRSATDRVEGFENLGEVGTSHFVANHALVFMVRGLYSKWKQPIGYVLRSGPVHKDKLIVLIKLCFEKLEETDLVKVIICDQGSNNRSCFQNMKVSASHPYITHKNPKIFCMYDRSPTPY